MKTNTLKIGTRLALGFGAMAVIALLLGLLAVFGIYTLSADLENIGSNRIPASQALAALNRERMAIRAQTQAVFAHETQAEAREGFRRIQEERRQSWQRVDRAWEALLGIPRTSEAGRALQQQLEGEYQAWRAIYVELDDLIARLAAAVDPEQKVALYAEYRRVVGRMVPISDQMGQTFDAMTENNNARTNAMIEADRALAVRLEIWAVVATALGLLLAALLGWFITRSVTRPIGGEPTEMEKLTQHIAQGDLIPFTARLCYNIF